MTASCINGGPFNGNGRGLEKPLVGAVLTFLSCLRMEAMSLKLTEGDAQRAIWALVGPKVREALLLESVTPETKAISYRGTVHWLLATYAKEEDIRLAESRLGNFRQNPDDTPAHFRDRLVTSMGRLKTAEELKAHFIFGSSLGAQATLQALGRTVFSGWDDLISGVEARDIQSRAISRGQPRTRSLANVARTCTIGISLRLSWGDE